MNRIFINIDIPVSPETAKRLQSEAARRRAGEMVGAMLAIGSTEPDPMRELLAVIKREAVQCGLTDTLLDEALAALNAERRI